MRILILGGDGMLGHQLLRYLQKAHDVRVTLRRPLSAYAGMGLFNQGNAYSEIDIRRDAPLLGVLREFVPEAVVNAVGIVKQRPVAEENIDNIEINALLPHRLAKLCKGESARLLHFST